MSLSESYPVIWKKIENREIPQKEIDITLLKFVLKLCKKAKKGEIDDLDIGDAFGIGIQHTNGKYKINPKLANFLIELGEYKICSDLDTPEKVEKEAKEILKSLQEDN